MVRPIIPDGIFANLGQWHSRYIHDPDFAVFQWLADESGMVLDVGANRGHSALSILGQTNHPHRWLPLVQALGYEIYCLNHTTGALNRFKDFDGIVNIFCLHRNNNSKITKLMFDRVEQFSTGIKIDIRTYLYDNKA